MNKIVAVYQVRITIREAEDEVPGVQLDLTTTLLDEVITEAVGLATQRPVNVSVERVDK